jgi:hypothetical protein
LCVKYMTFEQVTIVLLVLLIVFRETIHYFQLNKLQELLKSNDLNEYYSAREKSHAGVNENNNSVMDEENALTDHEEDFDIRKVSEVIIDGQKKPINIIS